MAFTTTLTAALLFATLFHASLSWDSSNIWFPDINNPVFYNMSFYQQAGQTIDNTDNLIPATETPSFQNDRKRPWPAVFNRLPDTRPPVLPTETPVVHKEKKPTRNRQPPKTTSSNGRIQGTVVQSDISRLIAEQEMFLRNEQGKQFLGRENVQRPQSAFDRLAAEQQTFIRNEQTGERFTVSAPQSGNRRHSDDRRNVFARDERRPDVYPDVPVGYKTVPLEETTAAGTQSYYTDAGRQQVVGNRLRRTKDQGIADGGNYFDQQQEQRWNGDRDAVASQTRPEARTTSIASERSFARPVQRAVDPAEENRRRWNDYAGSTGGDARTFRVEDNVIADREETSPKPAGPSKCVWAIISCCKPSSPQIRYTCFETLGCHGAFWDTNPCSKEMIMAAVQVTASFYNVPRPVE